jgi:predicted chitinase
LLKQHTKAESINGKNAVASACWFWYYKQLNEICDKPNDWFTVWRNVRRGKFEYLTIKINGGLNGYNDRLKYYLKARDVLFYLKTTHIDPLPEIRGLEKL